MPELWYKDGLQFTCSQCGDCCTGAPGFVWVNGDEIRALAVEVTGGDIEVLGYQSAQALLDALIKFREFLEH